MGAGRKDEDGWWHPSPFDKIKTNFVETIGEKETFGGVEIVVWQSWGEVKWTYARKVLSKTLAKLVEAEAARAGDLPAAERWLSKFHSQRACSLYDFKA